MTEGQARRLAVVVAHPDDETFGAGSLLLHAARRGARTAVVCATRGEAGEAAPGSGIGPDDDLGAIREQELYDAGRRLGVEHIELLGFRDSGLTGDVVPGTLAAADPDQVRDAVRERLEDLRPHVVVVLDASDGHRDHARIREATLAAIDEMSWPVERVYQLCFVKRLMRRWLDELAARNPDSDYHDLAVPGVEDDEITTVVDTAALLADREHAMAAHASQTTPFDHLPDDLRREFLTADRLVRLRPAWTGGPPEDDIL